MANGNVHGAGAVSDLSHEVDRAETSLQAREQYSMLSLPFLLRFMQDVAKSRLQCEIKNEWWTFGLLSRNAIEFPVASLCFYTRNNKAGSILLNSVLLANPHRVAKPFLRCVSQSQAKL